MPDADVNLWKKGWQGIGTLIVSLAPEWIGFQGFGASITCFLLCRICNLQFHLGQSRIVGQRELGARNEVIADQGQLKLGLRSWVTWMSRFALLSISRCYQDIRRLMGTRHVVPSRSSGFPVMWLVAPLSRIHLSLRSLLMSFMLWAHAFHGSTSLFCLPFLGKRFGVFLRWRNVIEASSVPPRVRISRFVPAALKSVCCHKPWAVLAPDVFSFAPTSVFWWD